MTKQIIPKKNTRKRKSRSDIYNRKEKFYCAECNLPWIQPVAPSYNTRTHLPLLVRGSPGISGSPCSSITFVTGRASLFSEREVAREGTIVNGVGVCGTYFALFVMPLIIIFFLSDPRDHLSLYAGNYVRAIANGHETSANFNQISCDLSRKFVANARSQERALPRRLLRRWKRNVIAQANEQPWPRLQGRFDYYPAAVEDAAETHRSEAALDTSARNRRYSRY